MTAEILTFKAKTDCNYEIEGWHREKVKTEFERAVRTLAELTFYFGGEAIIHSGVPLDDRRFRRDMDMARVLLSNFVERFPET